LRKDSAQNVLNFTKNASSRSGKTGFERFSLAEMQNFDLSKRKNIFTFVKILLAELLFNLSKGLG